MPITVVCPECRAEVPVKSQARRKVQCPECGEMVTVREREPDRPDRTQTWILIGACAGVISLFVLMLVGVVRSTRQQTSLPVTEPKPKHNLQQLQTSDSLPEGQTVIYGQRLQQRGVRFTDWKESGGGLEAVIHVLPDGKPINERDVVLTCTGKGGLKLRGGWVRVPKMEPGDSGRFRVYLHDMRDTSVVTIDLKPDAEQANR